MTDPSEIRTGRDLFRTTDDLFDYWYADAYGIHKSLSAPAYEDMDMETAIEVAEELVNLLIFCQSLGADFPDIHG